MSHGGTAQTTQATRLVLLLGLPRHCGPRAGHRAPPLQGAHTLQLSLIPPYPSSPFYKLPWVKPPEPALFLGRQHGVTPFLSPHPSHPSAPLTAGCTTGPGEARPSPVQQPWPLLNVSVPLCLAGHLQGPLPASIPHPCPPTDKSLTMSAAHWGALLEDKGLFCSLLAPGGQT